MEHFMKRILSGILLATGISASAMAADLPVKARYTKAPPPIIVYNWTGFYVGLHGGGDWFTKDWSTPTTPLNLASGCNCGLSDGGHSASSWLAGAQIGYNYQINNLVLGIEAQASWTDLQGANVNPVFTFITNHSKTDGIGTLAGRVGYAFDRVLLYGKGGGAWAGDRFSTSAFGGPDGQSVRDDRFGWMLGAGVEWAFMDNWSVKAEYDHLDFGTRRETLNFVLTGAPAFQYDIRQRVDLVKVGINYKFGGPLVARY
jgi:outer membrane immunogenic protein